MAIESIVIGGGCFWCLDSVFRHLEGVTSSLCGYTAGHVSNPTYEAVCHGGTGHAEVVEIRFDNNVISLDTLLKIFFTIHDPTTLNRQGNDVGTQYRSILLHQNTAQKQQFEQALIDFQANFSNPIVTEIEALGTLYIAEDYHQDYFTNNPGNGYCQAVIPPKMIKVAEYFS